MKYRTWVDPNKNNYLLCQLPSGRILYYFEPKMKRVRNEFLDPDEHDSEGKDQYRDILTCYTVDSKTNQWVRRPLYGGLLCENNIQSFCRDLLFEAGLRVEAAGYPIVLHVHDELLSETNRNFGSLKEFVKLMEILPAWATGMPVKAVGWEGMRFRK
jgi:DNA polymerase